MFLKKYDTLQMQNLSWSSLHYGEGPWWWRRSKHIQRWSHENLGIIYVWVQVVKCNVSEKYTLFLLRYQHIMKDTKKSN
jgi:hypothetical protein